MQQITFADKTTQSTSTGHEKDMHCGGATLSYHKNLRGWALPGAVGSCPKNLHVRVVQEKRAREIIQGLAKLYN